MTQWSLTAYRCQRNDNCYCVSVANLHAVDAKITARDVKEATNSTSCRRRRPPGNAVSGHSSTMCLVVWWLSPQGQAGHAITPHRYRDSEHLAWPHLRRFRVTNWRLDISKYRDTCERSISILDGITILRYIEYRMIRRYLGDISYDPEQCLSQDLDFFKKRSYWNFLGSYLQKRGVILPRRKFCECISNARIICPNISQSFSK